MKGLILVTGSDGLVGSRFVELTQRRNFLHLPTEVEFDITNPLEVKDILQNYNFSAVVNFAAYTNVTEAEKQKGDKEGSCWMVNFEGVKNLVDAIEPIKARVHFIQISTDMVFSGTADDPGPYDENHPVENNPNKLTWYGYSKAQAENYIIEQLGNNASIVRINYPVRSKFENKLDFLRKPLKLFNEGTLFPVFSDQQLSITFCDDVARILDLITTSYKKGIFHVSSCDTGSAYEIISYMIKKIKGDDAKIDSISIDEFLKNDNLPPVRYPKFSGLKCEQTQKILGHKLPNWKAIVDELILQGMGK